MALPAPELLLLSLPCHDEPVEPIFIIKTLCHKLLFELLILQTKQQILTNPEKSLCHKLLFLQEQTVLGHSVLHWECDRGARP